MMPRHCIQQSITDRFEQQVVSHPDRIAAEIGTYRISYKQLNQRANRCSHALQAQSDVVDEPVALLLPQGMSLLAAVLATLKTGKCYVPLDPSLPLEWLQGVIQRVKPRLLITDTARSPLADQLASKLIQCLNIDDLDDHRSTMNMKLSVSPEATAYIYFTSGSTGEPKGVFDSHRNVLHNIMRYTNSLQIGPDDRLTLLQSPSFSGAVSSMFGALLNGATLLPFDLSSQNAGRLAEWVNDTGATIYHSVPSIFRLIATGSHYYPRIRLVRLEGDQTALQDIKRYRSHFGPNCILVNGLGATECGLVRQYFVNQHTEVPGPVVPVGHAVEDMEVLVVDDHGQSLPADQVGEVVIRSSYLAKGYWDLSEQTAKSFRSDGEQANIRRYHTGDLGRLQIDGCLELMGRKDHQVKFRGQWIDTGRIEACLNESGMVKEAIVTINHDLHGESKLVAYYVQDAELDSTSLRQHLAATLPNELLPTTFIAMDRLPTNAYGKIDRRQLSQEPIARTPTDSIGDNTPRTQLEAIVADFWTDILNVECVGNSDDFFLLGGDSLTALQLLIRLRERLGVELKMSQVFAHSTIGSLAQLLSEVEHLKDEG